MKKNNEIPTSLLAFTFFYSVAIYIILIGFIFGIRNKDKASDDDKS